MEPRTTRPIGSRHLFANRRFAVDDSLLYTGLIHTMLDQCSTVVDVGCGRGWYADDTSDPHNLFDFRGAGRQVIGLDIDPAASVNPYIDEFRLLQAGRPWPTESDSADLIVSDWTLEHVEDPSEFVSEAIRTLRVGGVFVARSVNYYSLLSLVSRRVPNDRHSSVLSHLQPTRDAKDVFPAYYRMNSRKQLQTLLGPNFMFEVASRPGLENYAYARYPRFSRVLASIESRFPAALQMTFVICAQLQSKTPQSGDSHISQDGPRF